MSISHASLLITEIESKWLYSKRMLIDSYNQKDRGTWTVLSNSRARVKQKGSDSDLLLVFCFT